MRKKKRIVLNDNYILSTKVRKEIAQRKDHFLRNKNIKSNYADVTKFCTTYKFSNLMYFSIYFKNYIFLEL